MSGGWIGVDLDGTLAVYDGWSAGEIGAPVPAMVERVKVWRADGIEVRIFTARVSSAVSPQEAEEQEQMIEEWCVEHLGEKLPVTAEKDFGAIEIWDDRVVQVIPNTGKRADGKIL